MTGGDVSGGGASGGAGGDALRRAVLTVAALNFAWFLVEFAGAFRIGSVALLADSIDFLEDTAVNLLVAVALGWSAARRARVGMVLAALMLIPAGAFLWSLWQKFLSPVPPEAAALSLLGLGALAVNLGCAFILARFRRQAGSLTRGAFLSARNDAIANVAIVAAGLLTLARPSVWPDVAVGLGIALINLDAAREVWRAARAEGRDAAA